MGTGHGWEQAFNSWQITLSLFWRCKAIVASPIFWVCLVKPGFSQPLGLEPIRGHGLLGSSVLSPRAHGRTDLPLKWMWSLDTAEASVLLVTETSKLKEVSKTI